MMMCGKCSKITAGLLLALGLLFLLVDLRVWTFWGVQWWSGLFLLLSVVCFASASCKDCQARSK